jgi:long-chain fatty acid transport protein
MKKFDQKKIKALLLGASALALMAEPASADYIQTLGLGQKSSSLAGAVTATADDFDAFYTNPAGAANFTTPVIGLTAKLIDTTNLEINDGAGGGVKDTWKGEALATAPALGAYLPVMPGSIVMGLGIGAPFALAADYNDQDWGNTVTNDSASNIELLYIEAVPTIAVKVNDKLNIGFGVNIGLAKHLKLTTKFSNLAGLGPALMVGPVNGTLLVESDNDMPLPVAPWEFSTDPTAVTLTLGMQYKVTPTLTFGATYRGETPNEYEGDVRLFTNLASQVPGLCESLGPPDKTPLSCGVERFRTTIELPRHLQLGIAWQAMENWQLSFDVQWTNWSDATGFGTPLNVALTQSQSAPNVATAAGGAGLQGLLCQAGVCGVDQIHFGYDAQDTLQYRFGSKYDLNRSLSILMGYSFDEQFMPNRTQDLITPSSDRHWLTGGVELKVPSAMGLWKLNLGGQMIFYEDNTIGGSSTAGGLGPTAQVGPVNGGQGPANSVAFGTQTNPYEIGGELWTVGLGATLFFGATE